MTKFNWEKANAKSKRFKSSITFQQITDGITVLRREEFDINNKSHNPLGLSDEDCTGAIPTPEKRVQIVRYLLDNNKYIRDTCDNFGIEERISSKEFKKFCWRVFLTSFNWEDTGCELKIVMPIAVCFSVIYLRTYNEVVSKDGKATILTIEILKQMQLHIANQKITNSAGGI